MAALSAADRLMQARQAIGASSSAGGPGVGSTEAFVVATRADKARATKTRIIQAAQVAFSQGGYAQASLRDIAARAGVTSPLIVKYFSTKADLFRAALTGALDDATDLTPGKAGYAARMVAFILDSDAQVVAPAMIALSLGDEHAREIVVSVVRERIIAPVSAWIEEGGEPVRAPIILMLTTGLAIFGRYLRVEGMDRADAGSVEWLTTTLQALIDGDGALGSAGAGVLRST